MAFLGSRTQLGLVRRPQKTTDVTPEAPPEGYVYLVDSMGRYLLDDDGKYILSPLA